MIYIMENLKSLGSWELEAVNHIYIVILDMDSGGEWMCNWDRVG